MPIKGTAITVQYVAWDTTNNVGKTGDGGNHTLRAVGDGAEYTPAASPVEVDSTNLKGVYKIAIASGENAYDVVTLGGASSTSGISIIPITWTNTSTATVASYPGNTPQTGDAFARIGAAGAGLTALGDARLAYLDAAVSTRSTYAGGPVASVTAAVSLDLTQQLGAARALDAVADTSLRINDALHCAVAAATGKEAVTGTSYVVKTPSTGTVLRSFTLDSGTSPTSRT